MSTRIIKKPKVEIAPEIFDLLKTQAEETGQVIMHFIYHNKRAWEITIRIWPSCFLFDRNSDHSSDLVLAENITVYPTWQPVPALGDYHFTLIFEGLPNDCTVFDFAEYCNGEGGEFMVNAIQRTESDVYYLSIS